MNSGSKWPSSSRPARHSAKCSRRQALRPRHGGVGVRVRLLFASPGRHRRPAPFPQGCVHAWTSGSVSAPSYPHPSPGTGAADSGGGATASTSSNGQFVVPQCVCTFGVAVASCWLRCRSAICSTHRIGGLPRLPSPVDMAAGSHGVSAMYRLPLKFSWQVSVDFRSAVAPSHHSTWIGATV